MRNWPAQRILEVLDKCCDSFTYPMLERFDVVRADDPAIGQMYGLSNGFALIRPDGHVATIAASASKIDEYFATRLNP